MQYITVLICASHYFLPYMCMNWVQLSWVELSWVELSWAELSWFELLLVLSYLYVLTPHGTQMPPAADVYDNGHCWHSLFLSWKLSGHVISVHFVLCALTRYGHCKQDALAFLSVYVLSGQSWHASELKKGVKVPGLQLLHWLCPAAAW